VPEAEEMPDLVRSLFCRPVDQVGVVGRPAVVAVPEAGGRDDGNAACRPCEAEDEVAPVNIEVAGGNEEQGAGNLVPAGEGILQAVKDLLSIVLVAVPIVAVDEERILDESDLSSKDHRHHPGDRELEAFRGLPVPKNIDAHCLISG